MSIGILISLILLISVFCQYVAWRTKFPAIVYLVVVGLVLGPATGVLKGGENFQSFFDIFLPIAAALILFEGGLSLNFKEIRKTKHTILRLLFVAAPISYGLAYLMFYKLGGMSFESSIVLAAILIISGPTVVMPIIKNSKLNHKISSILKWEGIILDPIGALIAIFCYEYIIEFRQSEDIYTDLGGFTLILLAISLLSFLAGKLVNYVFHKGYIPEFLKIPFMLTLAITVYFLSSEFMHEGGLIGITIFGITMANQDIPKMKELIIFKENIIILVLSMVFIFIVATLDYSLLLSISFLDVALIALFMVLVRPISVLIGLSFLKDYKLKEKIFLSLISPKGIICVVLVTFLSNSLAEFNVEDVDRMKAITLWVVFISIIASSFIAALTSEYFKVKSVNESGVIIVGGNRFSLALGEKLKAFGFEVLITSKSWSMIKKTRMVGLQSYYGEILSEQAHFGMNFSEYEHLIITTSNPAYNSLVYTNLLHEFGRNRIFQTKAEISEKQLNKYNDNIKARVVSEEISLRELSDKISENWSLKLINISENHPIEEAKKAYGDGYLGLFNFDKDKMSLDIYNEEVKGEYKILALVKDGG